MNALSIHKIIEVDAPVNRLWQILTDNQFIPQYMFGCLAETDWKPGSPLEWRGAADGKLYVKGHVLAAEARHRLEYTTIDPNSAIADIPSNYLTMSFLLKERGAGGSTLEITQGDFATVEDGARRYEDSSADGNDLVLEGIKRLAEAESSRAG